MGETREYKLPEEGNTLMVNEPQKNWGGRWTEENLSENQVEICNRT